MPHSPATVTRYDTTSAAKIIECYASRWSIEVCTPDVAAVLIDVLAEGPNGWAGDSVQLWIGRPCVLPPVATYPPVAS